MKWEIGDRVKWRASTDPSIRTVYSGTVEELRPDGTVAVRDDGWGAISAVRADRLRPEFDPDLTAPTLTRREKVAETLAALPRVFRLRGFPGEYFRPSERDSYVNDAGGVTVYLEIYTFERTWVAHSKGSVREILSQLLEVSGDRKFTTDAEVTEYLASVPR